MHQYKIKHLFAKLAIIPFLPRKVWQCIKRSINNLEISNKCSINTTTTFIEKAKQLHGDKYDYSKVVYENNLKEVIIICKDHGEFLQLPKTHKKGNGCIKCGTISRVNKRTKTLDEFILQSFQVHNDKYDYSKVVYSKSSDKITIICKIHGEFLQTPNSHIQGNGCKKCSNEYNSKIQRNDIYNFIKDAKQLHGDKYDYSKVNYINNKTNVIITCKQHGDFEQIPSNHLNGQGCNNCGRIIASKNRTKSKEDFINKTIEVHSNIFDYSKIKYVNRSTNINIICKLHGEFQQTPHKHLHSKTACPSCVMNNIGKWNNSNTNEFVKKAIKIHGDMYNYTKVIYEKAIENVIIICKNHGEFEISPNSHLNGSGCSKCYSNFSKQQIQWLEYISKLYNLHIQHAMNESEYKIPTTNLKADGFCKKTNTVYEFHGDFWHGNPKLYNSKDMNPVNKKSFGELYQQTIARESQIKELGYKLIVLWEYDWNNVLKLIIRLQQKYRYLKTHK